MKRTIARTVAAASLAATSVITTAGLAQAAQEPTFGFIVSWVTTDTGCTEISWEPTTLSDQVVVGYEVVETRAPLSKKGIKAAEPVALGPDDELSVPDLAFGETSYLYGRVSYEGAKVSKWASDTLEC